MEGKKGHKRVVVLKCGTELAYFALYAFISNRYDRMESNANRTNTMNISQCRTSSRYYRQLSAKKKKKK